MKKQTQPQLLRTFKPKTKNQAEYIRAIAENQIVIALGPAGCGKTCIAAAIGCEYLFYGKVEKLIITRPIVESGRSIGYLPGTANEKAMPYMIPILDELNLSLPKQLIQQWIHEGKIEILPLTYTRGRNFHNSFVIADEMSNATMTEIKLLLTRIGNNAKIILTGDLKQSDLPSDMQGALKTTSDLLDDIQGISINRLYDEDIIRNPIISKILERLN